MKFLANYKCGWSWLTFFLTLFDLLSKLYSRSSSSRGGGNQDQYDRPCGANPGGPAVGNAVHHASKVQEPQVPISACDVRVLVCCIATSYCHITLRHCFAIVLLLYSHDIDIFILLYYHILLPYRLYCHIILTYWWPCCFPAMLCDHVVLLILRCCMTIL